MATTKSTSAAIATKTNTKPVAAKKATGTPAKRVVKKATKAPTKAPTKSADKSVAKTAVKKATKTVGKSGGKATNTTAAVAAPAGDKKLTLRGRSVFVVQTTTSGVVVRTAWLSEDKKLSYMPAVFPNVDYALNLLDDLRTEVLKHFSRAAQVGAQAIAQQKASQQR